ncbi:hypothetical protein ACS0TY_013640 [Phlomoides rotata]
MLPNENIDQLDSRFTTILNEINTLRKEYPKVALNIIRALPNLPCTPQIITG